MKVASYLVSPLMNDSAVGSQNRLLDVPWRKIITRHEATSGRVIDTQLFLVVVLIVNTIASRTPHVPLMRDGKGNHIVSASTRKDAIREVCLPAVGDAYFAVRELP